MKDGAGRVFVTSSVLGAWLIFLTGRQTALYPTVAEPDTELLPASIALVAISVAANGRLVTRSTSVAVVCMAVLVGGTALIAAQLGAPLANASEGQVGSDYCADFCRTAIMGHFVSFVAWPPPAVMGLIVLGRWDRHPFPTGQIAPFGRTCGRRPRSYSACSLRWSGGGSSCPRAEDLVALCEAFSASTARLTGVDALRGGAE